MYEELIGLTIDKTDVRFADFPQILDGEIYLGGTPSTGWETTQVVTAKQAKEDALSSITVTTTNGNTFDGDDVARADMLNAIIASDFLGLTEHTWKLSDNSWKEITLDELKEASALAIQRKGEILAS